MTDHTLKTAWENFIDSAPEDFELKEVLRAGFYCGAFSLLHLIDEVETAELAEGLVNGWIEECNTSMAEITKTTGVTAH